MMMNGAVLKMAQSQSSRSLERLLAVLFFICCLLVATSRQNVTSLQLFGVNQAASSPAVLLVAHGESPDNSNGLSVEPNKPNRTSWDNMVSGISLLVQKYKARAIAKLRTKLGDEYNCTVKYSPNKKHTPADDCRYADLESYIPLKEPPIWTGSMQQSSETKSIVDPLLLDGKCLLYGIGIASDSTFEQGMSSHCEVHAFDCTVLEDARSVKGKNFTFHKLCIGPKSHGENGLKNTEYGREVRNTTLRFQTLGDTMDNLNHSRVDYLKFDAEGT